jgi:hypothetical protein
VFLESFLCFSGRYVEEDRGTFFVSLLLKLDTVSPLSYKMGASPHCVADRRLIEWEPPGKFGLADPQLPGCPITQNTPSLHLLTGLSRLHDLLGRDAQEFSNPLDQAIQGVPQRT